MLSLETAGHLALACRRQTAVSTGLLLAAVMLGRTMLAGTDPLPGLDIDRSAVAWLDETALQATRETPGVVDAAVTTMLPGDSRFSVSVSPGPPGADTNRRDVDLCYTTTNGLAVLGRPLLAGRMFTDDEDLEGTHVVVVSATAAARLWPDDEAVGRRLRFTGPDSDNQLFIVIGVVEDMTSMLSSRRREVGDIYVPLAHRPASRAVGSSPAPATDDNARHQSSTRSVPCIVG